jgi:hypothetical protein
MKRSILTPMLLLLNMVIFAQTGAGYRPNYHFLHSGNIVADKNFYPLTAIAHFPRLTKLLATDDTLNILLRDRINLIHAHSEDTCRTAESLIEGFRWTSDDSAAVDRALRRLYARQPKPFDTLVDNQLRPSGACERWIALGNLDLLLQAWGYSVKGMNYILDQYGLGKKMRYPRIDSVSYDVKSVYYRGVLKILFPYLSERADSMTLFFQPPLTLAMELMRANDRDEPARFEPLEKGVNKTAVTLARKITWNRYQYSAILIPGEGPELTTVPFDPIGRLRCDLAATRWRQGKAPFIIVSGGYCHPFHTPYCEAQEMKRYLVQDCGIPEAAVIMDPQARHTTTNFRNGARLMIRYGFPLDKPGLCVSTKEQSDYIESASFDRRNLHELGYLPYKEKKRLSPHEISFYPVMDCLQLDPYDPLDP